MTWSALGGEQRPDLRAVGSAATWEAERNLREAASHFPQASLLLAPVLIEPAKDQLKLYLASGDWSAVNVAKDWMQQLNSASHAKQ